MKRSKRALFATMGFLGGVMGSLFGEVAGLYEFRGPLLSIVQMALWGMLSCACILMGLTWALEMHSGRRRLTVTKLMKAALAGGAGGLTGASLAQMLFQVLPLRGALWVIFNALCWGVCGLILGWRVSRAIPNLGSRRGMWAGAMGGFIGGLGFLVAATTLYDVIGRLVGLGVLGASLGLAIVITEERFRAAYLEILWTPNQTGRVSLGAVPVTIGGGSDTVFVASLKERAASVEFANGVVRYTDLTSGVVNTYGDGATFYVGGVSMVVHILRVTAQLNK